MRDAAIRGFGVAFPAEVEPLPFSGQIARDRKLLARRSTRRDGSTSRGGEKALQ